MMVNQNWGFVKITVYFIHEKTQCLLRSAAGQSLDKTYIYVCVFVYVSMYICIYSIYMRVLVYTRAFV